MQRSLFDDETMGVPEHGKPFRMRIACPRCMTHEGTVARCGPHFKARCKHCEDYVYFAPGSELEAQGVKL